MQKLGVKICGLKRKEEVELVDNLGGAFIGFVFFEKSPRNISLQDAILLKKSIKQAKIVAVTVNPSDYFLQELINGLKPDYIQLHGDETYDRIIEIKKKFAVKIIKAFKVSKAEDLNDVDIFAKQVDYYLFDSYKADAPYSGGSGLTLPWSDLEGKNFKREFFLSGGLNISNLAEAVAIVKPDFIDLSSGVESEKGKKSLTKITELFEFLKTKYELI